MFLANKYMKICICEIKRNILLYDSTNDMQVT